jgi:hypothetical protein
MNTLVLPNFVFSEIVATVNRTRDGLETGVKLFGTVLDNDSHSHAFVVLAIAGPGQNSTHQPAHYSGDANYATDIFAALGSAMPGIKWLGEMHVHPRGITWLSSGDRRTVREILTGTDDTVHPEEFIAGVMQRKPGAIEIYPYHFTRECLDGNSIPVRVIADEAPLIEQARQKAIQKGTNHEGRNDRSGICPQPEGSPAAQGEASRYHRLRQWGQRLGAYGRALWRRQADAR